MIDFIISTLIVIFSPMFLLYRFNIFNFKGWLGEKKTSFDIWLSLDKENYKRFHNIIIPSSNGTSQIDHILVSPYGIFIVETKNKGGWIFGGWDQAKWTQVFRPSKYSFGPRK